MKSNKGRLNVPGFFFGTKTGEFIDVPSIFGGKPRPKKSGKPHSLRELEAAQTISRARKGKQLAAKVARGFYAAKKRIKTRAAHKPTTVGLPEPCTRRFLEHMGMRAAFLAYHEQPEYFVSKAKVAYEVTDGFCPMVTVTSAREALIICASLANYGIAAYFNKIAVPP